MESDKPNTFRLKKNTDRRFGTPYLWNRQHIDSSEETPMKSLFIKISKTNSSREETILEMEIVLYDVHMYGVILKPNKVTETKKILQRHI